MTQATKQPLTVSVETKLLEISPSLKNMQNSMHSNSYIQPYGWSTRSVVPFGTSIFEGACNEIAGMIGVTCTLITFSDDNENMQSVLVLNVTGELSLANIPILQG